MCCNVLINDPAMLKLLFVHVIKQATSSLGFRGLTLKGTKKCTKIADFTLTIHIAMTTDIPLMAPAPHTGLPCLTLSIY